MGNEQRDVLQRMAERREEEALRGHVEGDPTAAILQINEPWLLEQLGHPVDADHRLAKVEELALRHG